MATVESDPVPSIFHPIANIHNATGNAGSKTLVVGVSDSTVKENQNLDSVDTQPSTTDSSAMSAITKCPPDDLFTAAGNGLSEAKKLVDTIELAMVGDGQDDSNTTETQATITRSKEATVNSNISDSTVVAGNEVEDTLMEESVNDTKVEGIRAEQAPTGLLPPDSRVAAEVSPSAEEALTAESKMTGDEPATGSVVNDDPVIFMTGEVEIPVAGQDMTRTISGELNEVVQGGEITKSSNITPANRAVQIEDVVAMPVLAEVDNTDNEGAKEEVGEAKLAEVKAAATPEVNVEPEVDVVGEEVAGIKAEEADEPEAEDGKPNISVQVEEVETPVPTATSLSVNENPIAFEVVAPTPALVDSRELEVSDVEDTVAPVQEVPLTPAAAAKEEAASEGTVTPHPEAEADGMFTLIEEPVGAIQEQIAEMTTDATDPDVVSPIKEEESAPTKDDPRPSVVEESSMPEGAPVELSVAAPIKDVPSSIKSHPEVQETSLQVPEEHAIPGEDGTPTVDVLKAEAESVARGTVAAEETPNVTEDKSTVGGTPFFAQPTIEAPTEKTAGLSVVEAGPIEQPVIEVEAYPASDVPVAKGVSACEKILERNAAQERLGSAAEDSATSAAPAGADTAAVEEIVEVRNAGAEPEKAMAESAIAEETTDKSTATETVPSAQQAEVQSVVGKVSEELLAEEHTVAAEASSVTRDEVDAAVVEGIPTSENAPSEDAVASERGCVTKITKDEPTIDEVRHRAKGSAEEDTSIPIVEPPHTEAAAEEEPVAEAPVTAADAQPTKEKVSEAAMIVGDEAAEGELVGDAAKEEQVSEESTPEFAPLAVIEVEHGSMTVPVAEEAPAMKIPTCESANEKERQAANEEGEQAGEPATIEEPPETQHTTVAQDGEEGVADKPAVEIPAPVADSVFTQDEPVKDSAVGGATGEYAMSTPVAHPVVEPIVEDDEDRPLPSEAKDEVLAKNFSTTEEPVGKNGRAAERVFETPIAEESAVDALSMELMAEPTAAVVEEKSVLSEEPEVVTLLKSAAEQIEERISPEERIVTAPEAAEEGQIEVPALEPSAIVNSGTPILVAVTELDAGASLDESIAVSEASEADTTTETIMVPEPVTRKKEDATVPVEGLNVSGVDYVPTSATDDAPTKKNLALNIPEDAPQIERPKSPWTPSFQVTTIGQGVSLPSEEHIPVHSLDNTEETKVVSPTQAATVTEDNVAGAASDVSGTPAEEGGESELATPSWTPSYSVHSQGSPSPTHVSLGPEISPAARDEVVEDGAATVEDIMAPEETILPVTENVGPTKVDLTAAEKTSAAEEPTVVHEDIEPKPANNDEPSCDAPSKEAAILASVIDGQEAPYEPKAQNQDPEKAHVVLEPVSVESQPPEQPITEDSSSLTPPLEQRPASPSWIPSYSVSSQGSPQPQQASLPSASADISEIRFVSLLADALVVEDPQDKMSPAPPTVVVNGTQPEEPREEVPTMEDRPSTPWTPSYSVTVQGTDMLEEAQIGSLTPPNQPEEPEPQPRRSLSAEMEPGAFSPTALIGAGVAGGTAVLAASAALGNPKNAQGDDNGIAKSDPATNRDTVDSETCQDRAFPTIEIPDENKFSLASLPPLDENSALDTNTVLSPDASPISSRKRLESTTSSRLFPGGWFSNTSKIPDERTSLEVAQGVFTGTKQGATVEEALQSPTADPITPVRELSSSDKRRWCIIM